MVTRIACIDKNGARWWFDKDQITTFTPVISGNQKHTPALTHLGSWILRTQSNIAVSPIDPFKLMAEQDMLSWAIKSEATDVIQAIGSNVANYEK